MAYAEGTKVPVEKTKAEIEKLVRKHGADQFLAGADAERAMVMFRIQARYVRFDVPLPPRKVAKPSPWSNRRPNGAAKLDLWYAAELRRRYRALLLVLKAKLEAVESGITSFEREFLAHVVLPDNRTVADHVLPAVQQAYETGQVRPMLLPGSTPSP